MHQLKISIFMIFCITTLIACSDDIEILEEPDYYKGEETKEVTKENAEIKVENKNQENEQKYKENYREESTANTPSKNLYLEKMKEKNLTETTSSNTNTIAPLVGLGDTKNAFINKYGIDNGEGWISRFSNDYILAMFTNERAYNITVQFEMTSEPIRTMDEAMEVAKQHMPSDSKLIREYIDGEDIDLPRKVMEYKSEKIAELFPGSDWGPEGVFVVVFNYLEGDENKVIGLTIGIGNKP
jgi:hypothetical protein